MRSLFYILRLSIISLLASTDMASSNESYTAAGPFEVVTVPKISLNDKQRGKSLELLVRHPRENGPFPLIIFSHGALANNEAFASASEHWASHGYVVIHPNHADASSGDRRGGGVRGVMGGTGRIERIRDVVSILDGLDEVEKLIPFLNEKIDRQSIGVAGHSFGAYVAQCHGGVRTLDDGKLTSFADPRVKAVVPISAQGESRSYGLTADSWKEAKIPAFHITGTRDTSAPDQPGGAFGTVETKRVPFDRSPAGGKYLLIIEGANHLSFGGKLTRRLASADAPHLTKVASLAFFEAHLRKDSKAKEWLEGEAFLKLLGDQATLEMKL